MEQVKMARETGDTAFHEEKGRPRGTKAYARCRCVQRRGASFSLLWPDRRKRGGSGVLCCVRALSRRGCRPCGRDRGRGGALAASTLSPWLSFPVAWDRAGAFAAAVLQLLRVSIVGAERSHQTWGRESGLSSHVAVLC